MTTLLVGSRSGPDELQLDVVGVAKDEGGVRERDGDLGDLAVRDVQSVEVCGPQVQVGALADVDRYVVEAGVVLLEAFALVSRVVIEPDVEIAARTMQKNRVSGAAVVMFDAQALQAKDSAVPRFTGFYVADGEAEVVDTTQSWGSWSPGIVAVEMTAGDHDCSNRCVS